MIAQFVPFTNLGVKNLSVMRVRLSLEEKHRHGIQIRACLIEALAKDKVHWRTVEQPERSKFDKP